MDDNKTLLVYWGNDFKSIWVLVPKKRGTGFLKVPFGEHQNKALSDIAFDLGYDFYGLDGFLSIETGYFRPDNRNVIVEKCLTVLSKHYGFPYRSVGHEEFWKNHPHY